MNYIGVLSPIFSSFCLKKKWLVFFIKIPIVNLNQGLQNELFPQGIQSKDYVLKARYNSNISVGANLPEK